MRCFPEPRRVGAVVGCPRRLSLCRMQQPEARFGPSVRRGLGAERPSWLKGHGWGWAQKAFARRILLPHEGEPVGSGFRAPETPSKAAGPRQPGQPCPDSPYGERGAGGENGLRCFLDPRRVGAVVFCPRRVSLCRMQLPEARFGPSVRQGLGAERPSWLRGHGCGLGAEGLRAPNSASPPRRSRAEWVSGTGDTQQSSRAQGARAAQPRFALWRAGCRGRKRPALLSRSEARWGCGLLPEESFLLQNAAARRLFRAVGATGPRR